jgi:hypothetical protein
MFADAIAFCLEVIGSEEISMLLSRFNVVAGELGVSRPKNDIKQTEDKKHVQKSV